MDSIESFQTFLQERARVTWTLKERDPRTGLFLPRMARRNKFTDVGLSNLAASWAGAGSPPRYLIIDSFKGVITNSPTLPIGATSVTLDKPVHQAGDTQLTLDVGAVGQETVTFTSASGAGPTSYILSTPTTKVHASGAWVMRPVKQGDTLTTIKNEVQYDGVAAPNVRMAASGAGYSQGIGNYVMQFFLTGSQALTSWVSLGLSDVSVVGQGQLHNHILFGYNHTSGNDVELDISLTIANG